MYVICKQMIHVIILHHKYAERLSKRGPSQHFTEFLFTPTYYKNKNNTLMTPIYSRNRIAYRRLIRDGVRFGDCLLRRIYTWRPIYSAGRWWI